MKRDGCPVGKFRIGNHCTKIGYSSHGEWSILGEIRKLEEERGNPFPKNTPYPDNTPAIWIATNLRKAIRYVLTADHWDAVDDGAHVDPALFEQLKLINIQQTDEIITDDGNGGYLLVRPKHHSRNRGVKI